MSLLVLLHAWNQLQKDKSTQDCPAALLCNNISTSLASLDKRDEAISWVQHGLHLAQKGACQKESSILQLNYKQLEKCFKKEK